MVYNRFNSSKYALNFKFPIITHLISGCYGKPMVTKDKKGLTFKVLGPSMIYNRFNREISCHRITMSPNQSVICLAPCHQTSQSFALPPCHQTNHSFDLPSTTASPHHCATASQHHHITASPHHHVSQSFALPTATKPVSHLPCPLPPNQSVIWLALYHHVTVSPHHHVTASPHHHVTMSLHHRITMLVSHLPCQLPPNQSVISLAPCHQTSQSFDLPSTTASPHHRVTTPPHHCITVSPC